MGYLATGWSVLQIPVDSLNYGGFHEMVHRPMGDQKQGYSWSYRNQIQFQTESQTSRDIQNMLVQKMLMRPCDHGIFPDNPTLFLSTATANQPGIWIASHCRTMQHSVKASKKDSTNRMPNIVFCLSHLLTLRDQPDYAEANKTTQSMMFITRNIHRNSRQRVDISNIQLFGSCHFLAALINL